MAWFKVDDGFYDHPKVEELPNAAVGLWVKAGTWCAKHETDGVIPATRVKALKGTASQIRALIECGLWGETTTNLGAKAYSFRDWFDYQPSREEREEERQLWREKKRKSRSRKLDNLRNVDNVPQGVTQMSPEGTNGGVTQMSGTIPDPSRPDPSINSGTTSQPTTGSRGQTEWPAGEDPLDVLGAATQRARDAGISETAIKAGLAEYDRRPEPKGPGLLRTLINDAWDQERHRNAQDTAKQQRLDAIANCTRCDDNGMYDTGQGLARCNHQPNEEDTPPWEKHA